SLPARKPDDGVSLPVERDERPAFEEDLAVVALLRAVERRGAKREAGAIEASDAEDPRGVAAILLAADEGRGSERHLAGAVGSASALANDRAFEIDQVLRDDVAALDLHEEARVRRVESARRANGARGYALGERREKPFPRERVRLSIRESIEISLRCHRSSPFFTKRGGWRVETVSLAGPGARGQPPKTRSDQRRDSPIGDRAPRGGSVPA